MRADDPGDGPPEGQPQAGSELSSAGVIGRNSVLNVGTNALLILLGLVFIPLMIRSFGMELYGVLTITWMVLGQLGWLNVGLGRASTRFVARSLALRQGSRAGVWVWTAVGVQVVVGAVGAVGLWLLAPALVGLLKVSPENYELVVFALRMFGLVIPVELAASSLRGVLEATQSFATINALSVLEATWTYSVYGLGIYLGGDLRVVVLGLVAYKVVVVGLLTYFGGRCLPSLLSRLTTQVVRRHYRERLRQLLSYGGWVAASQGAGPLLMMWDRWVISALLGAAVLPLYTVPMSLLQRLAFLPSSLTSTLFPAFTDLHARAEWGRIEDFYVRSHKYLMILFVPVLFVGFVWGGEALAVWIGPDFAARATVPLQIITVGYTMALLAPISGSLLDGAGRPDVLPVIYAFEIPINLVAVYVLTSQFGVVGAAWSFTIRAVVETLAVWVMVYRVLPLSGTRIVRECLVPLGSAAAVFAVGAGVLVVRHVSVLGTAAASLALVAGYALYTFVVVIDRRDVDFFMRFVQRFRRASV